MFIGSLKLKENQPHSSTKKRKGSGDSRGLQNRRSLSLMAMVGSTPTRFRQFSSRLACPPCRFSRPSQYRRSEGTFGLAKRRFLSYVMTPSPPSPRIIMRVSSIIATAKTRRAQEWFWRVVFAGVVFDFLYLGWLALRLLRAK